jgi:hypothetical protein
MWQLTSMRILTLWTLVKCCGYWKKSYSRHQSEKTRRPYLRCSRKNFESSEVRAEYSRGLTSFRLLQAELPSSITMADWQVRMLTGQIALATIELLRGTPKA